MPLSLNDSNFQFFRNFLLLLGGLAGVFYEAVLYSEPVRNELILVYVAMMGLPAFLQKDENKAKKE